MSTRQKYSLLVLTWSKVLLSRTKLLLPDEAHSCYKLVYWFFLQRVTYKKFMSLFFFCVYSVQYFIGTVLSKNVVGNREIKENKMEGVWPYRGGDVYRRGLIPSTYYVGVKAAWYVATTDAEIMSFNYFFVPFKLKWKLSQWTKIALPDFNNLRTFIKWNLWLLAAENS